MGQHIPGNAQNMNHNGPRSTENLHAKVTCETKTNQMVTMADQVQTHNHTHTRSADMLSRIYKNPNSKLRLEDLSNVDLLLDMDGDDLSTEELRRKTFST